MRRTATLTATAGLLASVALAGCAVSTPSSEQQPSDDGEGGLAEACIVGVWALDVPDYGEQSEAFMIETGIPITEFAMTGDGTITFTADGLVSTAVGLTISGVYVAGDAVVPMTVPSGYTATGDWSPGDEEGVIDLANWTTELDPDVVMPDGSPQEPAIDYTDIPSVLADCSANDLVLHAPDSPFSTLWHR